MNITWINKLDQIFYGQFRQKQITFHYEQGGPICVYKGNSKPNVMMYEA